MLRVLLLYYVRYYIVKAVTSLKFTLKIKQLYFFIQNKLDLLYTHDFDMTA